jgi:hypothetical protein
MHQRLAQLWASLGDLAPLFTDRHRWPSSRPWVRLGFELQGLLVFAFAFGFHAYFAPHGVDPHHDGIMFKPALDVSQGAVVFRDTFTQYGAATVLLQAAALKLFGAKMIVIKLQTALMYGIAFYFFWRVWCRLVPSLVATLVCLVGTLLGPDAIAMFLPWSSIYALVFQSLALFWSVRYFERGRDRELFYAGAAAALAFWCRQPVGAFLAGGLLVALVLIALHVTPNCAKAPRGIALRIVLGNTRIVRAVEVVALFGGGLLLVNAVALLYLAEFGALGDWWKQSIVFAQLWSSSAGGGHSVKAIIACLFPGGHLLIWCLMAVVTATQAMRATATFLDPKVVLETPRAATVLLASTVAVTSWLQYYPVACNYHCYFAGIPLFGVFAYAFYSSHRSASKIVRSLVVMCVVGIVFYNDVDVRVKEIDAHVASQNVPVKSIPALRGMRVTPADAQCYDALGELLAAYLKVHPAGTIVTTTGHGLFPALHEEQARYHPMYMSWESITPISRIYPDVDEARNRYVAAKSPMVIGPAEVSATHVRVGHISWQWVGYDVHVPKDVHPTEFLVCDVSGTISRRPIE